MFIWARILFVASVVTDCPVTMDKCMQDRSMHHLTRFYTDYSMQSNACELSLLESTGKRDDVCTWCGVSCLLGTITAIHWQAHPRDFVFHPMWFPSAVVEIVLRGLNAIAPLETRMLPKNLKIFVAPSCSLYGQLDLTALPLHLILFSAIENRFGGTVTVLRLPQNIEKIDLRLNAIDAVASTNNEFPDSLKTAVFSRKGKHIRYIALDTKPKGGQISIFHIQDKNGKRSRKYDSTFL